MEEKINARMLLMALLSMLLTLFLSFLVFRGAVDDTAKANLRSHADTLRQTLEYLPDPQRLSDYAADDLRITLIAPDGQVVFESDADSSRMDNHLGRPEVQQALQEGRSEVTRQSDTLGYDTYYCAVRTDDGGVLRVAMSAASFFGLHNDVIPLLLIIAVALLLLSVVLTIPLTRSLVRPIQAMAENIDDIDKNVPYKELVPFAKAIKDQQDRKQENARMRQEFTANVSHELKTPLTSISGYAEMIETGIAREADIKTFAGKIRFEAARLITLIEDILQLSQLDEPNMHKKFQPVDLLEVTESVAESLSLQASRQEVTLSVTGQPLLLMGNRGMLEELVYNLCDNAIRYNKPGGSVTADVSPVNGKVRLQVADTGIGIPTDQLSRVFERFYRVDKSRSKQSGGTGLGMAIVKHVALQHEGRISIESREGEGTRISVFFPTQQDYIAAHTDNQNA